MSELINRRSLCRGLCAGTFLAASGGIAGLSSQARSKPGPISQSDPPDQLRGEFFDTAEETLDQLGELHSALVRIREVATDGDWRPARERFVEFEFRSISEEALEHRNRAEELLRNDPDETFQELMVQWFDSVDQLFELFDERLERLESAFNEYDADNVDAAREELETAAQLASRTEDLAAQAFEQLDEGMEYTDQHSEQRSETTDGQSGGSTAQRGFFTNDAASSNELLDDPFALTVAGFLLSTLGILYQMVSH